MKRMKLIVMLVLVLGVTSSTWAISYNFAYSGQIRWKYINWDMGESYGSITPDVLYDGIATLDALPQSGPPGLISSIPYGDYAGQKEDSFGVFKIVEIRTDNGGPDLLLWSDDTDPVNELVGMLFGGVDNAVIKLSVTGQQVIQTAGFYFNMYEQPKGTFNEMLGSSGRIAFDKYKGVGIDPITGLPIGTLVIEGNSTPGIPKLLGSTGPMHQRAIYLETDANTGAGSGVSNQFVDVTGGDWQYYPPFEYEVPDFYYGNTDPRFGASQFGDLYVESTIRPYIPPPSAPPTADWVLASDDPVHANALVPEPITMLGLLLGIGGLGRYIRRRTA